MSTVRLRWMCFCNFYDELWTLCFFRSTIMFLLVSTLILSSVIEAPQVIGGSATVVQEETATLPCKLIDSVEPTTQISWQRRTTGKPQNDNFFTIVAGNGPRFVDGHDDRFKFVGSIQDNNGTLLLSRVTLNDEGTYTCIFTLFPSGNHRTEIPLNVLVPPVTNLMDNHPTLGNEEVSLATCTAAGSKPPAEVRWLTDTLAEKVRTTTNNITHGNGTTTTVSSLLGVPTREINNHLVQCIISSAALSEEEILPLAIQIYFSPSEVNLIETPTGLLECVAEANPDADFTFSRSHQSLPKSVRVEGATLHFQSWTSDLNGLYRCEASNPYGRKHGYLYVHVPSGSCTTCWTLFGLSLFLNAIVVAAAALYIYKSGKSPRIGESASVKRQMVETTSSSPPDAQRVEEEEEDKAEECL